MSCDPNEPAISTSYQTPHHDQGFGDAVHDPRVHTPMHCVAVFSESPDGITVCPYSICYNQHVNAGLITRYRFFLGCTT